MALFVAVIRKAINISLSRYKWSNRYHIEIPDLGSAQAVCDAIWNAERKLHRAQGFVYQYYVTDMDPETPTFTTLVPEDVDGLVGAFTATGDGLPAFNVTRVDLLVPLSRPSRKFYRAPMTEDMQEQGTLSTGYASAVDEAMTQLLEITALRDESGNTFSAFSVFGVTSRRLGKTAQIDVPSPPA